MFFRRGRISVSAADEEESNKNAYDENKSAHNDPYPEGDSCAGRFSFTNFNVRKKNGGKRSYVYGSGFCGRACNKFNLNDNAFGCFICERGKTGRIFDNKAVNTVFFNKFYVVNSGFEIGFRVIEVNELAVGHVIFANVFIGGNGMYHCENVAVIVGFSICLGSVKAVSNGAGCAVFICHSVGKKGDVESGKSVAVCNEFCGGFVGNAVTVKGNDADGGFAANVFFKKEFNFSNGNVAVDAESKAYGFENVLYGSFNNGRAAGRRFRFGAFGRGRAGTYGLGRACGFGRSCRFRRTCGLGRAGRRAGRAAFGGRAGRRTAGNNIGYARAFPNCGEVNVFVGCVESFAGFIGLVSVLPTYKNVVFIGEAGRTCDKIKRFIKIVIFGNGKSFAVAGEISYVVSLFGSGAAAGRRTGRRRTGGRRTGRRAYFFPLCGSAYGLAAGSFINASCFADAPTGEFITFFGKTESFGGRKSSTGTYGERSHGLGTAAAGTGGKLDVKLVFRDHECFGFNNGNRGENEHQCNKN